MMKIVDNKGFVYEFLDWNKVIYWVFWIEVICFGVEWVKFVYVFSF